jgi:hypothetical protein
MSGIEGDKVELRSTWKFMVDELLAPFNDPVEGYIQTNKGALSYREDASSGSQVKTTASLVTKATAEVDLKNQSSAPKNQASEDVKVSETEQTVSAESVDQLQDSQMTDVPKESAQSASSTGILSYFWPTAAATAPKNEAEDAPPIQTTSGSQIPISQRVKWAVLYNVGYTVDLTAAKVLALEHFVDQVKKDTKTELKLQKFFLSDQEDFHKSESSTDLNEKSKTKDLKNSKEIKDIKARELAQLQDKIRLLILHGNEAEAKILSSIEEINSDRQAQNKAAKSPATADAYLRIWANMWEWALSEAHLIHICLAFEAPASAESKAQNGSTRTFSDEKLKLFARRESLETKLVTYLFRTMFIVKLDEVRHTQKEYTGYTRQLPSAEAAKLLRKLAETIRDLNGNILRYPGLPRISPFITVIESVQQTVATAFSTIESTRYSILSDSTAQYLPSITPTIIASTPNKFLLEMEDILRSFHRDAGTLKTDIDLHLERQKTQETRKRLTAGFE